MKIKLNKLPTRRINVKKYKTLLILNTTRCETKIAKRKEIRLRVIYQEIKKLNQEMEDLFKISKFKQEVKNE